MGEAMWPDTLAIMGWDVENAGLGVVFDRAIPPFATENLAPAVVRILDRMGRTRCDVDRLVCHPGGAKAIEALEMSLDLGQGALADEREVLAEFGNMSAPTALFVPERALAGGLTGATAALALGPGNTASCVLLEPEREAA